MIESGQWSEALTERWTLGSLERAGPRVKSNLLFVHFPDYARAGYLVLPSDESRNRFVIWQTMVASLALLLVGLIPTITRISGFVYFGEALAIGQFFCTTALGLQPTGQMSRRDSCCSHPSYI